jgi:cytochrome c556
MALQGAAGTLDGLRASIGPVGGACGACHKAYREPQQ